jgi:molecular chaperone DnaJ
MSEDFYEVLGVSRDADAEDIKQAYRKKAAEYHPDVSDDPNAEEKFKRIKKAKEVLTDEEKRSAYDRMGHEQFEQAEKRGGFDGAGGAGGAGGPFGGGGGGDPFGGGGMGDIFEQFFGGGGGGGRGGSRQGADLKASLEITLEEAYEGVTKQLSVTRPERCADCDGSGHPPGSESRQCPQCNGRGQETTVRQTPLGRVQQTRPCRQCEGEGTLYEETCSTCGGEGVTREDATLQVEIPAGIDDGQTIRMDGQGAPGEGRGPNGDLLVEVAVADHPEFDRDGADLHYTLPVSFPQAVFGDTVEVPTLDGPVEMDLDRGIQSGETRRLRNKGMPRLQRRGQGDLLVHVQVVTPDPGDLDEEQREALEAFAEAADQDLEVDQSFFERIRNSF